MGKRHVPNGWTRGEYIPAIREAGVLTEFDRMALNLGLTERNWHSSKTLEDWVRRNCDFRYVPESLLNKLGIIPNDMATSKEHREWK